MEKSLVVCEKCRIFASENQDNTNMIEKKLYIGYVVACRQGQEYEIIPTTCTYEDKIIALDDTCHMAINLQEEGYRIACKYITKIELKWQKKSH